MNEIMKLDAVLIIPSVLILGNMFFVCYTASK